MEGFTVCRGKPEKFHERIMYDNILVMCPFCLALESKGITQTDADKIVESIKRSQQDEQQFVSKEEFDLFKKQIAMEIGVLHQSEAALRHRISQIEDKISCV